MYLEHAMGSKAEVESLLENYERKDDAAAAAAAAAAVDIKVALLKTEVSALMTNEYVTKEALDLKNMYHLQRSLQSWVHWQMRK